MLELPPQEGKYRGQVPRLRALGLRSLCGAAWTLFRPNTRKGTQCLTATSKAVGVPVPKRVLDGEGFWGSRKLRRCPVWIRREYPYLYPLADCNGSFELDIPVILGKLKPNRPDLSFRKLRLIFDTFLKEGLLFLWAEHAREYGHWTGSERVGRLPRLSRRSNKYEKRLAPPMPQKSYGKYLQRFGATLFVSAPDAVGNQARATAKATDRAKETPLGFDRFWNAYPRKVGKPAAIRTWKKTWSKPNLVASDGIMTGLERWKQTEQWQKEEGRYIPYPATFLNQRRWEDRTIGIQLCGGPLPRTERKPGKCSDCGAEIPAGFLKCLKCIKEKR